MIENIGVDLSEYGRIEWRGATLPQGVRLMMRVTALGETYRRLHCWLQDVEPNIVLNLRSCCRYDLNRLGADYTNLQDSSSEEVVIANFIEAISIEIGDGESAVCIRLVMTLPGEPMEFVSAPIGRAALHQWLEQSLV